MADFSGQKNIDREKAFWSKTDRKESWKCWPWTASTNKDGYGQFWTGNTFVGAHRYAWELTRKCKVPEGKMILHMCDSPSCCNPDHLYCGDVLQNAKDRQERSPIPTHLRSLYAHPKLHEGEIWLIRRLKIVKSKGIYTRYKFPESLVAKMFRVDQALIHLIWNSDKYMSKEGIYA